MIGTSSDRYGFYDQKHQRYVTYQAFEDAYQIDFEINILKSNLTPEQAAEKRVPLERRKAALSEYARWQMN